MKVILDSVLKAFLIVLAWLAVFDIGSQVLIKVLDNKRLNNYFSYGLSTEAQIRNMFNNKIPDDSVLHAGWINKRRFSERGTEADITLYGMSFSNQIADQLMDLDPEFVIRKISGPSAPINHSLSSFLIDKDVCQSKIVVLGVLDSSIKYINSMTNDTIGVDAPYGSFYPRFITSSKGLEQIHPLINSFGDLQAAMSGGNLWEENLEVLKSYDKFYCSFIYKQNVLDYSIIGRFVKRWYKAKHNRNITREIYNDRKFNKNILAQAENLIALFVKEAKANSCLPFVILIETQQHGNSLGEGLGPFLNGMGIDYLITGNIVSTTNPANFKSDGHFTMENNKKIAVKIYKQISVKLQNFEKKRSNNKGKIIMVFNSLEFFVFFVIVYALYRF